MITRCDGDRKDEQEDYGRSTGGLGATLDLMTTRPARGQDRDRGPLLTVAQAGEYLGTGERFIRRLITERRIAFVFFAMGFAAEAVESTSRSSVARSWSMAAAELALRTIFGTMGSMVAALMRAKRAPRPHHEAAGLARSSAGALRSATRNVVQTPVRLKPPGGAGNVAGTNNHTLQHCTHTPNDRNT